MKRKWILPLLGGIAIGGAVAGWWPSKHANHLESSPPEDAETSPAVAEDSSALRVLGRSPRFRPDQPIATPQREDPVQPAALPSTEPADLPTTEEDRKQQLASAEAAQTSRIEKHGREPRDQAWASSMEGNIHSLMTAESAKESGLGKYQGTDCRSESCLVNFTWTSSDEARKDLRAMIRRTASLPCSRSLVLPSDSGDGRDVPLTASVYLDCTADRNPGVL